MGMDVGGGGGGLKNEPNVVPMIDVLLVLLIIFMMIVPASRKAIDLQLPDPNPPQNVQPTESDQIVLEVLPGQVFEVNNQAVAGGLDGLMTRLRDIYNGRPDKLIFVKGHPEVTYQEVIDAMDTARGAGVLVIGVPPRDAEPARVGK